MNDKKTPVATDAELMSEWIEGVGGNIHIGAAKIKSVKVSKKGDRLTLVIKRTTTSEKKQEQSGD
jgi:hypothetical protein